MEKTEEGLLALHREKIRNIHKIGDRVHNISWEMHLLARLVDPNVDALNQEQIEELVSVLNGVFTSLDTFRERIACERGVSNED